MSDNGEICYYTSLDLNLYIRDLYEPENEKIASNEIHEVQISSDGKIATYLNEYNYDKSKDEFYFVKQGESPEKIASDITSYKLSDDTNIIHYLTEEGSLFRFNKKKEDKEKIADDVLMFSSSPNGDTVVFEDNDNTLHLQSKIKK